MKRLNHYSASGIKEKRLIAAFFIVMLMAAFPFSKSFSNNLTITNVTYSYIGVGDGTVTFDLTWKNSWRNSVFTSKNWDAAWIFVKWRDCSFAPPTAQPFTHATVSETVGDHTFAGTTILEPTKKDGTVGIDASPDNTGVMLRRATDGTTGDVSATVTLKLTNLPSGSLDFRIYGIEMVFVPQNTYVLGDGDGYIKSDNSFTYSANPTAPNINSMAIVSENAQPVSEATTNFCPGTGVAGICDVTAAFPKGYAAFYTMKYEISQGQYADFLNAINSVGQSAHYPNTNLNRMTIVNNITPPTQYSAERPDRACNFLSWINVSAYLDWAALRPLTELEYEKASRGTETAIPYQKAWGTTTGTSVTSGGISGSENGTETISGGANVNVNSIAFTSGDGNSITGPLRCGIFATGSSTTRDQSGMGFYGAMELSGNVTEYYVSVVSGTSGRPSVTGVSLGDGSINTSDGNHDLSNWPSAASPSSNIIRRGGDWSTASGNTAGSTIATNISYRGPTATSSKATSDNASGGRGGR